MHRKIAVVAVLLIGLAVPNGSGHAQKDLGLGYDLVFSQWININDSLLAIARAVSEDPLRYEELVAATPATFEEKEPADVLELLKEYRTKFDKLRRRAGLRPIKWFNQAEHAIIGPSILYVNSGYALSGHVEFLLRHTGPDYLIGQFYTRHDSSTRRPATSTRWWSSPAAGWTGFWPWRALRQTASSDDGAGSAPDSIPLTPRKNWCAWRDSNPHPVARSRF